MNIYRFSSYIFLLSLLILSTTVRGDLNKRAPDTLPGTLPQMRELSFWVERMEKPDEVILTLGEIRQRNENYVKKMSRQEPFKNVHTGRVPMDWQLNRWPCRFLVKPDLDSMTVEEIAALVKEKIRESTDFIYKEKYGNYLGVEYADWEIKKIESETAIDLVGDSVELQEGIAVCTTRLRVVPSFFPSQVGLQHIDRSNYCIDLWCSNLVKFGRSVTVLHRSRSGSHVFVLSNDNFGWIESQDIAFCSKDDKKNFTNPEYFLVCTGKRVPFYSDESCRYVSGWLRMGDRIPLVNNSNNQQIKVPSRRIDGELMLEIAYLTEDADIHVGYLPYTCRNIIETAFKLLDEPYDWTGSTLGWNHETIYRDIFACFGFVLPHNGGLFTHYCDKDIVATPDMTKEERFKMILDNEPFVTLVVSRGHAMLLMGEYKGEPVAFDQSGYNYIGDDGITYEIKRCGIITTNFISYFLKYPITFLELK